MCCVDVCRLLVVRCCLFVVHGWSLDVFRSLLGCLFVVLRCVCFVFVSTFADWLLRVVMCSCFRVCMLFVWLVFWWLSLFVCCMLIVVCSCDSRVVVVCALL